MSDDILIGNLDGLTVGEAACPDDAVIFGTTDANNDERENQTLTEFTPETDQ